MLELRQLRYFVTIVDAGSLTRAAELLYVAQPALSQQLAILESNVNARLLNRSSKGINPTEAGTALYKHAQTILKLVDETKSVIKSPESGISGRVRLAMPGTTGSILAAPLVEKLRLEHPGIILEVYEHPSSYLVPQLLEQRVDLSFLVDNIPSSGLEVTPIANENLYFIHHKDNHPFGKQAHVKLDELIDIPLVLPTRTSTLRQLIDNAFSAQDIEPMIVAETSSTQTLLRLAANSPIGTIQTLTSMASSLESKKLIASLIQPVLARRLYLAYPKYVALSEASTYVHSAIIVLAKELMLSGQWRGAVPQYQ
ncbi:LysR family transcriptional regulator [Orrella sp. NBD-18]|uniref:LysR family transcriptional regulator n=1 Tax=Sheuella amnicola TaxID=2707330 RepID=A0A6B2QWZ5_9BURK|nr:LysR substrate-binding domain-containing protein [Sheuella amnicola]NDY82940.1 LysR family transcriptional regulator [Sheuella amnicola]